MRKVLRYTEKNNISYAKDIFFQHGKGLFFHIAHSISEIAESGWCVDQYNQDQNEGVYSIPGDFTWNQCLQSCKTKLYATGCEWDKNRTCAYHTATVSGGSGGSDHKCQKLGNNFH